MLAWVLTSLPDIPPLALEYATKSSTLMHSLRVLVLEGSDLI